jgi:heterodisulfide reductase subunit C
MGLRRVIKLATDQDINICHACYDCNVPLAEEMDIPLGSLVQLALLDDEEALSSRTLWSDAVLEASHGACKRGLNLPAVIVALREESLRRRNPEK